MRRRIVFTLAGIFLLLGVLALGYRHLSATGNAGYVIIGLGDWVLETSLYFVIVLVAFLFVGLYLGIRFMTGAARLPDSIKKRNLEQRGKRSLEALTSGLIETIEGKWEKAERNLIRHAGDSALPLINYLTAARAAHARGASEQREDYLRRARDSVPQADLAVALTRVKLLMGSHGYGEALEQLTEINRSTPNHPVVLRLMCEAYTHTRDWDALHHLIPVLREARLLSEPELGKLEVKAYRTLLEKRAMTRDPGMIREIWRMVPPPVRAVASVATPYFRGMIDAGVGEEVEQELRLALGREWNADLLVLYAVIRNSDPAGQLHAAEEWLAPHPDDARLLQILASLALRAGQTAKSLDYARRSLDLQPTMEACRLLGDWLHDQREHVAACLFYREGLRQLAGEPVDHDALNRALALLSAAVSRAPGGS